MAESQTYSRLNSQWKSTCRLLLGKEVGELSDYSDWLLEGIEPTQLCTSEVSGKEVHVVGRYAKNSSFISSDEINYGEKSPPLSLNELKDVDSIIEALSERVIYAGNIVLGNSSHIEQSTGIENGHFVLGSHTIHNSQDIAYCSLCREDKTVFGSVLAGESDFVIKARNAWRSTRCLENSLVLESSDIYYSHDMEGCSQCMFCFGLKAKRHCIGNLPLSSAKYAQIKAGLIEEIAEELQKRKRLRWFPEFAPQEQSRAFPSLIAPSEDKPDMGAINGSFEKITDIVLGKPLRETESLEGYFSKNIRSVESVPSAVSGRTAYYDELAFSKALAESGRMVKYFELTGIAGLAFEARKISLNDLRLSDIPDFIEPIAYFTSEHRHHSKNVIECPSTFESHDCFRCSRAYSSENSCYSFWPRDSEYLLGCDSTRTSSFCINCYNSFKLSRCFETDTSQSCTGAYFCHNCENVHDSMFCFNKKNLRYAIGNVEVGREVFQKVKNLLMSQITDELEKKKDFKWNIYNIGAGRK